MPGDAPTTRRVFVSYSHKDASFKAQLVNHLEVLQQDGHLEFWEDLQIDAGADFRQEIDVAIKRCNIALLLVSEHFLRSEFIRSIELAQLLQREASGDLRVIPIIVRPCPWRFNRTLSSRNALPPGGKPIITFLEENGDRNQAWTSIVEGLVGGFHYTQPAAQPEAEALESAPIIKPGVKTLMFCGLRILQAGKTHERNQQLTETYHALLRAEVERQNRGLIVRSVADGILAAFENPSAGVAAALAAQQRIELLRKEQPEARQIQVRFGLHMGEVNAQELQQAAAHHAVVAYEIMCAADDNQILLSSSIHDNTYGANFDVPRESVRWANHGDLLFSTGNREIHEISDASYKTPEPPASIRSSASSSLARRLELSGISLLHRVSEGGVAPVYKATAGGTNIAVKVLTADQGEKGTIRDRFVSEAKTVAQLNHHGIVKIHSVQDQTTPPYIVMDWIEGERLDEHCNRVGTATEEQRRKLLEVLCRVCDTLDFAHAKNSLHGDLKPSNIIIRQDTDWPVLIDFGFAFPESIDPRATERSDHQITGSPLYMAPEQITSGELTPKTDIYSLGIIIYEMFVGKPPFAYETAQQIREAQRNEDPPLPLLENPTVPEAIQRVCLKAIEKAPGDRYQSVGELRRDLQHIINNEPVLVRPRLYNNLIESRAVSHLSSIRDWFRRSLITEREHVALAHAYAPLIRSGIAAVSESRLMHVPIVMMYFAGLMLFVGTSMLLIEHEELFGPNGWLVRAALGLLPTSLTIVLWDMMLKRGRYRAAFVLSLLTIVSMPFALNNALYEAAYFLTGQVSSIGSDEDTVFSGWSNQVKQTGLFKYANWQVLIALTATFVWARYQSRRSLTFSTASLCALLLGLAYLAALDLIGLTYLVSRDRMATFAILLVPLVVLSLYLGSRVRQDERRQRQAIPFFVLAFIALVTSTSLFSGYAPDNFVFGARHEAEPLTQDERVPENRLASTSGAQLYLAVNGAEVAQDDSSSSQEPSSSDGSSVTDDTNTDAAADDEATPTPQTPGRTQYERTAQGLLFFLSGVFYAWLARLLRKHAPVEGSQSYLPLLYLSVIFGIGGLIWASEHWPWPWLGIPAPGKAIPLPAILALGLSVMSLLRAVQAQSYVTMILGLLGATISVWNIEINFEQSAAWSTAVLMCGLVGLLVLARGHYAQRTGEDIDDVGERLMSGRTALIGPGPPPRPIAISKPPPLPAVRAPSSPPPAAALPASQPQALLPRFR